MKRDETNQQYEQITKTDHETGVQYQTRTLAFKNGVLYIELTLDRHISYDKSYRQMAVQSAIYYRKGDYGFDTALAAKVSIYTISSDNPQADTNSRDHSLDSIIGIMYQDGILN